ncbi:MAG: hypothetical protein GKS00_22110 [Alphaproteobacteria bacterium]|nr:hypothetical protein [Alphaproteobacteria bacterium]
MTIRQLPKLVLKFIETPERNLYRRAYWHNAMAYASVTRMGRRIYDIGEPAAETASKSTAECFDRRMYWLLILSAPIRGSSAAY